MRLQVSFGDSGVVMKKAIISPRFISASFFQARDASRFPSRTLSEYVVVREKVIAPLWCKVLTVD